MSFTAMTDVPNPIFDSNGDPFSGAVLKAYLPGTTTSTSIFIDSAGSSPQTSVTANAKGIWEVSGNAITPYIDKKHKWGIFADATNATANTPFYMGPFDNVEQGLDALSTIDSELITYTPPFTSSTASNVEAKLSESLSVEDFGAAGDDSTLSGAAINAAITAAKAAGIGTVTFAGSIYLCEESVIWPADIFLQGTGPEVAFLKRPASTTYTGIDAVLKTENFDTLTGGSDGQQSNGVPTGFGMDRISVDGNRFNGNDVTTKHNIRIYGKRYYIGIVISVRAGGTGFYSECATFSNTSYLEDPETNVVFLRCAQCGEDGVNWTGPNDAYVDKVIVERCSRYGYYSHSLTNTNAKHTLGKIHAYSCGTGIWNSDGIEYGQEIISESSTVGSNIIWDQFRSQVDHMHSYSGLAGASGADVNISGNRTNIGNLRVNTVGGATAVIVSGNDCMIDAQIQGTGANAVTVTGLNVSGERNNIKADILEFTNATAKGLLTNSGSSLLYSHLDINAQLNTNGWKNAAAASAHNQISIRYSNNTTDFDASSTALDLRDKVVETGANHIHPEQGTATLSSGTFAVSFNNNQPSSSYQVSALNGNAAETFSWASKTVGGFTINSSNGSSSAVVDWKVSSQNSG